MTPGLLNVLLPDLGSRSGLLDRHGILLQQEALRLQVVRPHDHGFDILAVVGIEGIERGLLEGLDAREARGPTELACDLNEYGL
jgi:hypothetical protein